MKKVNDSCQYVSCCHVLGEESVSSIQKITPPAIKISSSFMKSSRLFDRPSSHHKHSTPHHTPAGRDSESLSTRQLHRHRQALAGGRHYQPPLAYCPTLTRRGTRDDDRLLRASGRHRRHLAGTCARSQCHRRQSLRPVGEVNRPRREASWRSRHRASGGQLVAVDTR